MQYLDPKNDVTFKKVFGEHPDLIKSLLNSLLPLREDQLIESVEYLSLEMLPNIPGKKNSIVDVHCVDKKGRNFIVEMQMHWTASFMTRMLHNASRAYSGQLNSGEPFNRIRPVYALCLINEIYLPQDEDCVHTYTFNDGKPNGHKISGIEIVSVELPKFKPDNFSEKKMMVLWLRFLTEIKAGSRKIPEGLDQEKELRKAIEVLEESSYSEEELAKYYRFWDAVSVEVSIQDDAREEGKAEGREEGKAEGRAEGRAEEKKETARKLLKLNTSIEVIQTVTGLSEVEINQL
ncbi:MAG: Rpn family recombination-promoting nuclease/putative transposase [Mangrovibacterium sp.]